MKLLTILINNRIDHIVDFEPRKKSPDSYIVENTGGDINLFMFYRESETSSITDLIYQTQNGKRKAKLSGITAEGLSAVKTTETNEITLNLYLQVDEDQEQDFSKRTSKWSSDDNANSDEFVYDFDKQVWDAKNIKVKLPAQTNSIYKVNINFHAREGCGVINRSSLEINVVPAQYIWDVVLDYGSESSQMLIFNRGTNHQVSVNNIVPLFSLFESALGDNSIEPSEYLQFDADDGDNFFKSVFFAHKNPDSDNPDPCAAIKENVNLKLMTPVGKLDEIRRSYLTIPNIKVASHGGVRLPKVQDSLGVQRDIFSFGNNYFYRALINSFLYQAMRHTYNAGNPAFLNICLLMPNVYTQSRVTENLVNVADDVLTLAKRNKEVSFVSGVEVAALSESDASFLGFTSSLDGPERSRIIKKGRYLILDAGKGTLDFSVLDYNPEADARHMYNSIFRSGIIGAGNAITYSVLLAVLNDVIENKWSGLSENRRKQEISDFIKSKVTSQNADEASLCAMLESLEQYKRSYNAGELNTSEFPVDLGKINSLSELELDALNNILVSYNIKKYKVKDDSYILNMINELAVDVANKLNASYSNLKSAKIDYVFFAGRGFQMMKLRGSVQKYLEKINPNICSSMEPVRIGNSNSTSATCKNICLFVREPISSGRYNGRIVGKPQLICHNEILAMPEDMHDGETSSKNEDKKSIENGSVKDKIKKWIIKHMPGPERPLETCNYLGGSDVDELNRELVNGFTLNFTSSADVVVFSGVSYPIPPNISAQNPAQIFFTGSEFVFRQDGELGYLSAPTNLDCQHVFESSFPFVQVSGGNSPIPFPRSPKFESKDPESGGDTSEDDYGREDEVIQEDLQKTISQRNIRNHEKE